MENKNDFGKGIYQKIQDGDVSIEEFQYDFLKNIVSSQKDIDPEIRGVLTNDFFNDLMNNEVNG